MSSTIKKRQNDLNRLNHFIHHPTKRDVQYGQDMQAKQNSQNQNSNAILNRYIALVLVKLLKRKETTIKYSNKNQYHLTAQKCDTNILALIKSLNSIKFITISHKHKSNSTTQVTIKLSPIGKDYIYKYIPRYKQIYRYLKSGSITMKNSRNSSSHNLLDLLSIILDSLLGPIIIAIGFSVSLLFHSLAIQAWIIYITIFCALGIPLFLGVFLVPQKIIRKIALPNIHENINRDIKKATRGKFIKFLKENQIKEPDYRFGYNNNLPKIDTYLFK